MELNFPQIEQKILKFWEENKIFEKLRKKNQNKKRWSFLDGPITANNPMGVHHAWGRTYKDVFQRYKALQGFDQRFQNGFDCQGLWVEVEVEKELGFENKKDIEKYGIANFVNKCKERVKKYSKIQTEQSIRLGQWMEWENSYYTMSDENNYAIWHFLKKCWQEKLLYKGRDVVPWCIRCGTAISQHEILTEEYQEIMHKAVYVKLPVIGKEKTYLLIWTTTPWTLPANVAVAVNPKLEYAEIQDKDGDIYILLKEKESLIQEGKILNTYLGSEILKNGYKYVGPFDDLPHIRTYLSGFNINNKELDHRVIAWEEISSEEGTGIVHIAPGCGQEDFKLSKELGLPYIDPLNDESRFREGFDFLTGKLATEVNNLVFENLKNKGFVYKIEDYRHRYPTCWRCKEELIFRLVDEWYISMEKLRKPLMEVAKKIKWLPSFGLERELDWLKNMQDWLISKKRYWGLALPIFECSCGNFEVIGSKEELKKRAIEGWEEFEGNSPHRPWVDKVKIKCSKCGKIISRISDVGNPWLDAGIVPFSTMKYFSDKKYWKTWFPADFICESFPGQFKNWFYSLIVMSTVLEKTNPTKTIFGYASVRDEKGEEMHKSKGNAIWFDEAVGKIGADPMRWMYIKQNPVLNLLFGYNTAKETKRKLLTLWNSFIFFKTYTEEEKFLQDKTFPKTNNILDKWIISRLNNLIDKTTKSLDGYNSAAASSTIEDFFIEDLSLWYIRRSRSRFQRPKDEEEKKEAVSTLYYVLLNLIKIIAPIMPFLAEEIYQELKTENMPESVHLCDWPKAEKKLIDSELEEKMTRVREIVNLGLKERAQLGIKVRQPLEGIAVGELADGLGEEYKNLAKEELNVKGFRYDLTLKEKIKLNTEITPELRKEGEKREILRNIRDLRKKIGLSPSYIVSNIKSTIGIVPDYIIEEEFKKEAGAEKFIKVETENEMTDVDVKKEIELECKKHYIGIKK